MTLISGTRRGVGQGLWTVILIAIGPLAGCALYGPGATQTSHLAYNGAVQASAQQELLLNLVRLRYADAPEFLEISSISAQMSFDAGASIGGAFGEVEDANSAFVAPGGSVGYSERPTISFTPERGTEFTRQLVAPVELDSLYLLTQYGWSMERVLRLVANDVNGMRNTIGREARRPELAASLESFASMAALFGRLHERGALRVVALQRQEAISAPLPAERVGPAELLAAAEAGYRYEYREQPRSYVLTESRVHYVLQVEKSAWETPELRELAHLLNLQSERLTYDIDRIGQVSKQAENLKLRVDTRSVLGSMAYLSHAVHVPAEHARRGLVSEDAELEGALSDLLRIKVAERTPGDATLSVPYRGFWFYIEEADLASKRTMGLLTSLVRLEISTGGAQNVPILTLPVSQ